MTTSMEGFDVTYVGSVDRAERTKSFRFLRPEGLDYVAGQFAFFTIPAQGRGTEAADKPLRHHFTLSSSPTEPFIEFTTRMTGSPFKDTIDSLKPGTVIRLEGVGGRFTLAGASRKVAYVTGGIGITPARSAIRWVADIGADFDIVVLYGNRNLAAAAFADELDELAGDWLSVVHVLKEPPAGWQGPTGLIDADLIRAHVPDCDERRFMVSGPPAMVEAMNDLLIEEVGIDRDRVETERFTGY